MPMLISVVVSALMEKMDGRRSLVQAEAIQEFERAWKELTSPAASPDVPQVHVIVHPPFLLPRWKLKALCNLLMQGETVPCAGRKRRELRTRTSAASKSLRADGMSHASGALRLPCVFGQLFVKPEDEGGLSLATFYSELEAVHDCDLRWSRQAQLVSTHREGGRKGGNLARGDAAAPEDSPALANSLGSCMCIYTYKV